MLYFIAVSKSHGYKPGFVRQLSKNVWVTIGDIRNATTYDSFEAADAAAKYFGIPCYAILANCIG